jgi:histidinol-phosphate/aromatic aminotransferase/cobyric acid decarboxylase-like protein
MSIRLIARELYRLQTAVEKLEKEVAAAAPARKDALKETLRKLKAERNRMRRALDGQKSSDGP